MVFCQIDEDVVLWFIKKVEVILLQMKSYRKVLEYQWSCDKFGYLMDFGYWDLKVCYVVKLNMQFSDRVFIFYCCYQIVGFLGVEILLFFNLFL